MGNELSNGTDWDKYKIYIIESVRELKTENENLRKNVIELLNKISALDNDITSLQIKSGLWGLLAGAGGVLLAFVIKIVLGL